MKPLSKHHQAKVDHAFLRALRSKALIKQERRCAYCRDLLTQSSATADHIHPRSKGGLDREDNLVAACASCNRLKGSKSASAFMKIIKRPEQMRGPFFYAHLRWRLNLRIERAERRILASVGLVEA